jgi:hypothetical protein
MLIMSEEYIVFPVVKVIENIEGYEQKVTFGEDYHHVFVRPKPVKAVFKDGQFYDKEGNKLTMLDVDHSYTSKSTPFTSVACAPMIAEGLKKRTLGEDYDEIMCKKGYGFPIPLKEFEKSKSAKEALKKFASKIFPGKFLELSSDLNVAKEQLLKLGIDISLVKQNNNKR